ncbi:hypothetical protein [Gilvimarinus polysaccharolyticus]|uniref:hypothetical protein n=1 Tax=Gilvimarinus polysaccharolyticus TaxID=863921 RepID=UPI00067375CD|nr:hypothetical protein [Gilvimarinus polysaccharolyticus]
MRNSKDAIALIRAGNWSAAHHLVQDGTDEISCLLHAYLHREEGDLSNASYWYHRAGESLPDNTLAEELARLTSLANQS